MFSRLEAGARVLWDLGVSPRSGGYLYRHVLSACDFCGGLCRKQFWYETDISKSYRVNPGEWICPVCVFVRMKSTKQRAESLGVEEPLPELKEAALRNLRIDSLRKGRAVLRERRKQEKLARAQARKDARQIRDSLKALQPKEESGKKRGRPKKYRVDTSALSATVFGFNGASGTQATQAKDEVTD